MTSTYYFNGEPTTLDNVHGMLRVAAAGSADQLAEWWTELQTEGAVDLPNRPNDGEWLTIERVGDSSADPAPAYWEPTM